MGGDGLSVSAISNGELKNDECVWTTHANQTTTGGNYRRIYVHVVTHTVTSCHTIDINRMSQFPDAFEAAPRGSPAHGQSSRACMRGSEVPVLLCVCACA